jgi:hypothetical protein
MFPKIVSKIQFQDNVNSVSSVINTEDIKFAGPYIFWSLNYPETFAEMLRQVKGLVF